MSSFMTDLLYMSLKRFFLSLQQDNSSFGYLISFWEVFNISFTACDKVDIVWIVSYTIYNVNVMVREVRNGAKNVDRRIVS